MSGETGKCDMCGKHELRSKLKIKKGKRFCSSQCSKAMKAQQYQQSNNSSTQNSFNKMAENSKKSKGNKSVSEEPSITENQV